MAQLKIYSAEITRFGPVGVIIITAYENAGGYPRSEYYLLIPKPNDKIFSNKLGFDVKKFEDSPVELNEELMLSEALAQAKIDLGIYLEELAENSSLHILPNTPNIRENGPNLLVGVWLRGTCPHLQEVYNETEDQNLKDYISKILKLPVISKK